MRRWPVYILVDVALFAALWAVFLGMESGWLRGFLVGVVVTGFQELAVWRTTWRR